MSSRRPVASYWAKKGASDGIDLQVQGATKYTIFYTDENGKRRKKTGATDKGVSQRIANDLENKALLRRQGLTNPKDEGYRDHEAKSLAVHLADFQASLEAKGALRSTSSCSRIGLAKVVALVRAPTWLMSSVPRTRSDRTKPESRRTSPSRSRRLDYPI